jgi:hypothetical protein
MNAAFTAEAPISRASTSLYSLPERNGQRGARLGAFFSLNYTTKKLSRLKSGKKKFGWAQRSILSEWE